MGKLIDATATNAEGCDETTKIKTHFAKIVVGSHVEKPCYSILWFDPADNEFHIGYSSFRFEYVRIWLEEEFEIIESPMDITEVIRCKEWQNHESSLVRGRIWCKTMGRYMKEDGFCSLGERRIENG